MGALQLTAALSFVFATGGAPERWREACPGHAQEVTVERMQKYRDLVMAYALGDRATAVAGIEQIPELVKHAFLAAEDDRFFEHHGIDYIGVVRAVLVDTLSGHKTQGASTITRQTARNVFLTLDKSYRRKLQETFVTYEMEHEFSKEEILGLYLNVIFLGQRAYGVSAAAETYFGKSLDELSVAEAATLAGPGQQSGRGLRRRRHLNAKARPLRQ